MSMTVVSGLKMYTRKGGPAYFPRMTDGGTQYCTHRKDPNDSLAHIWPSLGPMVTCRCIAPVPSKIARLGQVGCATSTEKSWMREDYRRLGSARQRIFQLPPPGLALPGHAIPQKNWKVPGSLIAWSTEKDPEGERVPEIPVRFNARQRDD